MICVQMPVMVGALIPVILLEAVLIRRWLGLSYVSAFRGVALSNLGSTLIGVPIAWGIMFIIELGVLLPVSIAADHWHWQFRSPVFEVVGLFLSCAWLGPIDQNQAWLVPAAAALLLIPSFYVSVWIERRICIFSWKGSDPNAVRRCVYHANLASYLMLFVLACVWLGYEYFSRRSTP